MGALTSLCLCRPFCKLQEDNGASLAQLWGGTDGVKHTAQGSVPEKCPRVSMVAFSLSWQPPGPMLQCRAQAKADITNQSQHPLPNGCGTLPPAGLPKGGAGR